ncbi:hypothetical protein BHE74_00031677 [Ensete ventricosum]|nr:hypothetical protein BHE74_00031677 [Ensete ventricosum]
MGGVPVDTPWILIVIEVYWLVHPEFRSIPWRTDRYATVFLDHSLQVSSKQNVIDALIQEGFSTDIARMRELGFSYMFLKMLVTGYVSYVVVHADNPDGLFRILSSSFLGLRTR